jgi:hypothetical protein
MIRRLTVTASALPLLVVAVGFTGVASAQPADEPSAEASCAYTLSAPELVSVSGAPMVTARLTPFPCGDAINPNSMTVCITTQGSDSNGQCGFEARPIAAHVFVPYRPGTTYESTGRGCGSTFVGAATTCSSKGPITATL